MPRRFNKNRIDVKRIKSLHPVIRRGADHIEFRFKAGPGKGVEHTYQGEFSRVRLHVQGLRHFARLLGLLRFGRHNIGSKLPVVKIVEIFPAVALVGYKLQRVFDKVDTQHGD